MKKHYDVALAGIWFGTDYGSLLNGYASYKALKSLGKSVLMVRRQDGATGEWGDTIHSRVSSSFIQKFYPEEDISPSMPIEQLSGLNDVCDCFIAGPGSIWDFRLNETFSYAFMLNFADDGKRKISLSTSFESGHDETPASILRITRWLMRRFDAVSVRELTDVDICHDVYGIKAEIMADPVFYFTTQEYAELAEHSEINETEPYVLSYFLDPTPGKREAAEFYSRTAGIKVINIVSCPPSGNDEASCWPGVEEFLKLYIGASFVITDDFYGTCFAMIFNKPFLSVANCKQGSDSVAYLLNTFALMPRLAEDPQNIPHDEKYLQPIAYEDINRKIESERKKAIHWLRNAMETPIDNLPGILYPGNINTEWKSDLCNGCGACVSACPCDALKLLPNELGYYRPVMNYDRCIDCGKCAAVCPLLHLPKKENVCEPECYAFIAADSKVLEQSSSGGVFSLLAEETFRRNGRVAGAAWKDDFSVEHILISSPDELSRLQKSKYLQSYMGDSFRDIKKELDSDIFVLFSGCPCQVAGLKSYLGREYENLILVDLLCSHAPSAALFQKYLEDEFTNGVLKYEFRHKAQGTTWNCETVAITETDGTRHIRLGGKEDIYQRVYHNHVMCPSHCAYCQYQTVPRYGDITIGDFWKIATKDISIDTTKGVSVVLCNNDKGKMFFGSIPPEAIGLKKKVPLDWLGGNGYAIRGSRTFCPPERNVFYEAIKTMPFKQAVEQALK